MHLQIVALLSVWVPFSDLHYFVRNSDAVVIIKKILMSPASGVNTSMYKTYIYCVLFGLKSIIHGEGPEKAMDHDL